jgi:hypothetical protein
MNKGVFAVSAVAALCCLRPAPSAAETVLTSVELLGEPHSVVSFSIAPNDSTIAFNAAATPPGSLGSGINIWTISPFATSGRQITTFLASDHTFTSGPMWSQSGVFIAYFTQAAPPSHLFALQLAVTSFGAITPASLFVFAQSAATWSTDGGSLAFAANTNPDPIQGAPTGLYTVSADGNKLQMFLSCPPSTCGNPQWSPTDDIIAYEVGGDIALVNPDGSGGRTILTGVSGPVWSPFTGQRLAFSCGTDVCLANEDGSDRINITNGAFGLRYSSPSWSNDELLITMLGKSSDDPAVPGDVYVITTAGNGMPVAVTSTGNAFNPQWSPVASSNEIFYLCQHGDDRDICVTPGSAAPAPAGCGVSSCSGCCVQNLCLPGTGAGACGTGGDACAVCPTGQSCSATARICVTSSCDVSNCNGCCDSSNVCHPGTSNQACGRGGAICSSCPGGEVCDSVQALCLTQLCSAATCTGCCDAQGICQGGTGNAACGGNGFACAACTGGSTCSTSRICETQGCDISSCATGCCDVNGICHPGNSAASCGYSGFACASCGGEVCDTVSHTCAAPETCSSATCPGCCGPADNLCHAGSSPSACGFSGFTCEDCGAGGTCSSGAGFCI